MTSACPYCFTRLQENEEVLRCTSGACEAQENRSASDVAGFPIRVTPNYRVVTSEQMPMLPDVITCRRCQGPAAQLVCPCCRRDLPRGWREADVFTVSLCGARGAGKSVYIAVVIEQLRRYAVRRGRTVTPFTEGTRAVYETRYYEPLFHENKVMESTLPMAGGSAYQRDPLIWQVSAERGPGFFLVFRDAAGEDLEGISGQAPAFSYLDRSDLVVFLFDSLRLPSMIEVLAGLIPHVDRDRQGKEAAEVIPLVLSQITSGHPAMALAFSKFDAFQELPKADNVRYASVMGNPAAHFNRDDTMATYARMSNPQEAINAFWYDGEFLDAEVRALFAMIREESVTIMVDQARQQGRIADVRHFAVSAVGESPQHPEKLTERGISPFRVLDPLLWGLARAGRWI